MVKVSIIIEEVDLSLEQIQEIVKGEGVISQLSTGGLEIRDVKKPEKSKPEKSKKSKPKFTASSVSKQLLRERIFRIMNEDLSQLYDSWSLTMDYINGIKESREYEPIGELTKKNVHKKVITVMEEIQKQVGPDHAMCMPAQMGDIESLRLAFFALTELHESVLMEISKN